MLLTSCFSMLRPVSWSFQTIRWTADLRRQNGQDAPWNVKYWGIGNEMWGGGGNMRADYYSDLCRQSASFLRDYDPSHKIYKIASGACDFNYDWTQRVAELTGALVDALSLHYYTIPGSEWEHKGSATKFTNDDYYWTLGKCREIEDVLKRHIAIMDKYDPKKQIALMVDEWGTWWDEEPGTVPGHLYQQNTMRDAMVAAATLNIFNEHSGRVVMANIAQMVNVLQAIILTEGEKMVKTPTYHIFDLYKHHHDATLVYSHTETQQIGLGDDQVPQVSASVSVDKDGVLHATLANLSDEKAEEVELAFVNFVPTEASGRILSGNSGDHNDFDHPDAVTIQAMEGIRVEDGKLFVTMPACSAAEITIR